MKYPHVFYSSDRSGIPLDKRVARKYAALECPDFTIPDWVLYVVRPDVSGKVMGALFLEIKVSPNEIWKADKKTLKNKHIIKQWESIEKLRAAGYAADWGVGLDDCLFKVDDYMGAAYWPGWSYWGQVYGNA